MAARSYKQRLPQSKEAALQGWAPAVAVKFSLQWATALLCDADAESKGEFGAPCPPTLAPCPPAKISQYLCPSQENVSQLQCSQLHLSPLATSFVSLRHWLLLSLSDAWDKIPWEKETRKNSNPQTSTSKILPTTHMNLLQCQLTLNSFSLACWDTLLGTY